MHVVVTGATGFLGVPLCRALLEKGHRVVALSRSPTKARERLPAEVTSVRWSGRPGDATTEDAIAAADVVVNLAGETIFGIWTAAKKRRILQSRVDATRAVVEAIARTSSRERVLLQGSGVDFYGNRGDEVLTERSGPGEGFLARVVAEWEHAARPAENHGARVVMLRTGIPLATDGGALKPQLLPFRLGLGGPLGDGRQWWPWIHRRDWVDLVLFAMEHESIRGPLNLGAPQPARQREFAHALGKALGRPAIVPLPAFLLRLVGGELANDLLLSSRRMLPEVAQRAGFTFTFPDLVPALCDVVTTGG